MPFSFISGVKGLGQMMRFPSARQVAVLGLALVVNVLAGWPSATAAMPGASGPAGAVPISGGVDGGALAGGTVAVITEASSSVTFVDALTLSVRATAVLPQAPVAVALSPDGALAYVASPTSIMVVDTARGTLLRSATYPDLGIACFTMTMGSKAASIRAQLAISPDGKRLSTLAVGCGRTSNLWVIDPITLAIIGMSPIYREDYGSVDYPKTLIATNASTLVTKSQLNESANETYYLLTSMSVAASSTNIPCGKANYCYDGKVNTDMPGTTTTGLPYPGRGGLAVTPASGALLAPTGQTLAVLDPATGATTSQITGFFGTTVLVDQAASRAYGDDGSVVDLGSGKALGALPASTIPAGGTFFAFENGRGYAESSTGLSVVDVASASLVPTRVPKVSVKVSRVGARNARAIVTWTKPAGSGTSPITGYRVVGGEGQTCNTKKTTCTLNLSKPSAGKYYTFTVTALNKSGASTPTTTKARATGPEFEHAHYAALNGELQPV